MLLYGVRAIASSRALTGDIWHAHYGAAAISAVLWANSGELTAVARDAMLVQAEEMAITKQVKGLKPSLVTDAERSHFEEPSGLSRFVLNELSRFKVIYRAEAHHDLIGHLLTFSHALNVLHDLGLMEQRRKGLSAWLVLAEVLRASRDMTEQELLPLHSPVDKLPLQLALRSQLLPAEAEYWSRSYREADWDFGHTFKFASSFYDHIRRAGGSHPKAEESFRRIC